jgi:hypothetical protein
MPPAVRVLALGISPRELLDLDLLLLDSEETPSFLRMLRLGAIDYVIALHREGLEDLQLLGVFPSPFARPIHVYRVPDPLPRVFAVGTARVLTGSAAHAALLDPGFDPRRELVLSEGAPVSGCCAQSRLIEYAPDRIGVDVETTVPAYVVVVDAWAPGWRASVDGSPAPVLARQHRLPRRARATRPAPGRAAVSPATGPGRARRVRAGRPRRPRGRARSPSR